MSYWIDVPLGRISVVLFHRCGALLGQVRATAGHGISGLTDSVIYKFRCSFCSPREEFNSARLCFQGWECLCSSHVWDELHTKYFSGLDYAEQSIPSVVRPGCAYLSEWGARSTSVSWCTCHDASAVLCVQLSWAGCEMFWLGRFRKMQMYENELRVQERLGGRSDTAVARWVSR